MLTSYLVSFLVLVIGLLVLSTFTQRLLIQLLGTRLATILLWPGVVVHELSHLLGALLTLTRVTGFSVLPQGGALGSVTHAVPRNPVVLIAISVFPIFGASFVLWALAQLLLPGSPAAGPVPIFQGGWFTSLALYLGAWWGFVQGFWLAFNPWAWQSWLFAYLAFTIAAHLAPSRADLGHAATGLTVLSILAVLITWGAGFLSASVGDTLVTWVVSALQFFVPLLAYALALVIFLGLVVACATCVKRLNNQVDWWSL